jgi:YVTN family beta-propeller protein
MSIPAGQVVRTIVPWANVLLNGYHRTWAAPALTSLTYDPDRSDLWLGQTSGYASVPSPMVYLNLSSLAPTGMDFAVTNSYQAALDPVSGVVYLTDPSNDTVWVVNATTGNLAHPSLTVGGDPEGIAYDSDDGDIYVADSSTLNVSIIDTNNNTVSSTTPSTSAPLIDAAYDPKTTEVFFSQGTDEVIALNTSTNTFDTALTVGDTPTNLTVDATSGDVYVTNFLGATVSVVDALTNTVAVAAIPVGTYPNAIAWVASNDEVYVANVGDNNVTVISAASNAVTVSGIALPFALEGDYAQAIAVDPSNGYVYVGSGYTDNVSAIDSSTNTCVGMGPEVNGAPVAETYDSPADSVFVTEQDEYGAVTYEINATTFQTMGSAMYLPGDYGGLPFPYLVGAVDPAAHELFLVNETAIWETTIFNTTSHRQVTTLVPTAGEAAGDVSGIVYDALNNRVYEARQDPSNVTVIDPTTNTVTGQYYLNHVGFFQSVLDPTTGELYILDAFNNDVTVFNTTTDTYTYPAIPVTTSSFHVVSLTYDSADGLVYVLTTNYGEPPTNVTVINPATHTTIGHGIPIEGVGEYIAYDPDTDLIYVSAQAGYGPVPWNYETNLTVLSGASYAAAFGPWTVIYTGYDYPGANILFVPSSSSTTPGEMWAADLYDGSVLVISVPPLITSFSASPSAVDLGQSVTFQTLTVGGTGALSYTYGNLPPGCASTLPTFACTPTAPGTFSVLASVQDGVGLVSELGGVVQVTEALGLTARASVTSVLPGQTITFSATTSGGTEPYNVTWSFGDGDSANAATAANATTATHSYAAPGFYAAVATVTDALGQKATYAIAIDVTSAGGGSTNSTALLEALAIGLLVVGLVAGLATGTLLARRRRPPPTAYTPSGGGAPPGPPPGAT